MSIETYQEAFNIGNKLKKQMLELNPNCQSTIVIKMWEDNDFEVECRYGDDENIHIISYHKSKDKNEYFLEKFLSNAIKVDGYGNEYYVPNELIKYMNTNV